VHWCSQQRGSPGIPLDRYKGEDLEREYHTIKSCAPFCTVGCVHRVAQLDELRDRPVQTLTDWFTSGEVQKMPAVVRALAWMFVTSPHRDRFRAAAQRLLGVR